MMRGDMHYTRGEVVVDEGELRIDTHPSLSIGQLLALPIGTEVLAIHIGPMGVGLMFKGYIITQKFKDTIVTQEWHSDCDHGMTLQEIEGSLFPGSVFVVLMPENYVPDVADLINEKFVRKGFRDGMEGAPMASASSLQTKFGDDWHDDAYSAYTTSYKRGAENRKKGR